VTAKLCESAKGAKAAEMSLHPARLWTESPFGKEFEFKTAATAAAMVGARDQLDRQTVKSSPLMRPTPPGLPPVRDMARTHTFAVTGPIRRAAGL
jgi:hypothetical protein